MLPPRNFQIIEAFIIFPLKLNTLKFFSMKFCDSKSENEIMEIELANHKLNPACGLVLGGSSPRPSSLRTQAENGFYIFKRTEKSNQRMSVDRGIREQNVFKGRICQNRLLDCCT